MSIQDPIIRHREGRWERGEGEGRGEGREDGEGKKRGKGERRREGGTG